MKENEEKTILLNLQEVEVEQNIDKITKMDLSKVVGNIVHQRAGDIGLDDKAREIYHKGEAEVSEYMLTQIRSIIEQSDLVLYVRTALMKHIDNKKV